MRHFTKLFLATSALTLTGTTSYAAETINPITSELAGHLVFDGEPDMGGNEDVLRPLNIGIARLDGTRLIATPYGELEDWHFLDKRTEETFTPISAAAYLNSVPEISYGEQDSDNKLDEIRITAADKDMDFVVVYTVGRDADWADLGGAALRESEFDAPFSSAVYRNAEAKAVVMDTYTGEIYGALKADDAEFGVGELTDEVQELIETLHVTSQSKV